MSARETILIAIIALMATACAAMFYSIQHQKAVLAEMDEAVARLKVQAHQQRHLGETNRTIRTVRQKASP